MSLLEDKIARLTPRQRQLLELRLGKRRASLRLAKIEPQSEADFYPTSFAQERLWFVDRLQPGLSGLNLSHGVHLKGPLRPGRLRLAFTEVVRRHESLRTIFLAREGRPVQVIEPPRPMELPVIDISNLAPNERRRVVRRWAAQEALHPFDLTRGPLLRGLLLRLGEKEHVITCVVHHIVSDEWSLQVLWRDLTVAYGAFVRGQPSPLPDLPVQYRDFAICQRQWLQGRVVEELRTYWQQKLEGAPTFLKLPTDYPQPQTQSFRGSQRSFELPRELVAGMAELSSRERCSAFMTSLAAFQLLLHHYSGSDKVVVCSPISFRNWQEVQQLIGFFVNMLLFVGDFAGDPTFRELLARVRQTALEAFDHQHLPLQETIKGSAPERNLGHNPFLQLSLNFVDRQAEAYEIAGLEVEHFEPEVEASQYDMNLVLLHGDSRLRGWWQYRTDLFAVDTVDSMIEQFLRLVEQAVRDPDLRVSRLLEVLGSADEQRAIKAKRSLKRTSSASFDKRRRKQVRVEIP